MNKQRLIKLQKNKTPCQFTWLDITSKHRESIAKINDVPPIELLSRSKLYGIVHKIDDYAVIIVNDIEDNGEDDDEADYTAIPIHNIIDIKELKGR